MTYDLEKLRDLERRLSEATGAPKRTIYPADRIGEDLIDALYLATRHTIADNGPGGYWLSAPDGTPIAHYGVMPDPLASLDAAVALVERVLPDWHVTVRGVNSSWHAEIVPTASMSVGFGIGHRGSPALALCLALVRALIAKSEGKQP